MGPQKMSFAPEFFRHFDHLSVSRGSV